MPTDRTTIAPRAMVVDAQDRVNFVSASGLCHRLVGLLGQPACDSGRLRPGDGGHGRGDHRRRAFMSPVLHGRRSMPRIGRNRVEPAMHRVFRPLRRRPRVSLSRAMSRSRAVEALEHPRFRRRRTGQGHPLRGLRPRAEPWLGERGDLPRYPRVCRRVDPSVVAPHGQQGLPARDGVVDPGRRRRKQWISSPTLEGASSSARRADRPAHLRVPLPAGHQQMKQDRTSHVLSHYRELAGPAAGQPRGDHPADRQHDHDDRVDHPCGAGQEELSEASRSPAPN
jgi:hypothetical protein